MSRARRAVAGAARGAIGLLVDDGAVALGVVLAVAAAALLTAPLGSGDAVGWILFALIWAALGVSLWRARPLR
ncbi:MAG: hypothetical protein M3460_13940 [Actinomycetota bacterium]|nr:hypothetical protein [Actinomycetota bacterium]